MKKQILILPILSVALSIRLYFLIQINEPILSFALLLNLTSILIFCIFIQSIFSRGLQIFLVTLFLSISPWHISLLKVGSKINLMIVILLLSLFPLKRIYQKSRILFTSILIFILIILSPLNILKAVSNTIYHTDMIFVVEEQRREHVDDNFISFFLHNKLTNYLYHVLLNYAQHFSLQVLFLEGNVIPEIGLMYLFDFLFLSTGLIYMIKRWKGLGWIIIWILLAPLISSLDKNPQIHISAYSMVIPLVITSGIGFVTIWEWLSRIKSGFRHLIFAATLLIVAWDISRFLHQVQFHLTKFS